MSLDAETILEAEEILGTMQNYLESSMISIIEDLSLSEVGAHTQVQEAVTGLLWWGWKWQQCPARPGPVAVAHHSLKMPLPLQQSKTCLDAQNELSLLTAITEILDSTDDETLSPFDTIMDAELLTSAQERENPSVSCRAEPAWPQNTWEDAKAGLCHFLAQGCPEVAGPWSPVPWDGPCDW